VWYWRDRADFKNKVKLFLHLFAFIFIFLQIAKNPENLHFGIFCVRKK